MPRRYLGRDIARWLVDLGLLERRVDSLPNPAARLACFPQRSGVAGGHDLNVHTLTQRGIVLAGRLRGMRDGRVLIGDDPAASLAKADQFAIGVRKLIDGFASRAGLGQNHADPWPSYRRPGRTAAHVEP